MGISEQRNLGLSLASTKYVAFLDDDDIWLPNKLEEQFKMMEQSNQDVCLVYGGFRFYHDSGYRWGEHTPSLTDSVLMDLLWTRNPFSGSASNPMLSLSHVLSVGCYDTKIKVGEDWELYLRLAERYEFAGVNKIILEIRQHSGPRLGQRIDAALSTDRKVYLRYKAILPLELRSRYLQKMGGKFIRIGNKRRGRKLICSAIKVYNYNLIAWFQFILTLVDTKTYCKFHSVYRRFFRTL